MSSSSSSLGTNTSVPEQIANLEQLAAEGACRPSSWADEFNVTSIAHDPVKWNKDWECALRQMYTDSRMNVYERLVERWGGVLNASFEKEMRERVLKVERSLGKFDSQIWLLVNHAERARHALNGFLFSLAGTVWGQDARVLCPDITTSMLLKNSVAFILFLSSLDRFADRTVDDIFLVRGGWWDNLEAELLGLQVDLIMVDCLMLVRTEFIVNVALYITTSAVLAFNSSHLSESMAAARQLMMGDDDLAKYIAIGSASFRERPVIRCQRCEMCAEELRILVEAFKRCNQCRERLGSNVVYCSLKCQREDWPQHKRVCGKERIDPPPGSVVDVLRSCLDGSEIVKEVVQGGGGQLTLSSIRLDVHHTPRSRALQRQIHMLECNPDADYILFDPANRIIMACMLPETDARLVFRLLRREAMKDEEGRGAEALADAMLRCACAEGHPIFTRETVLAQFCAEYGDGLRKRLLKFEKLWGGVPAFPRRLLQFMYCGPQGDSSELLSQRAAADGRATCAYHAVPRILARN